ncbi:hypothetical protein EJB05_32849, partial [Eragrostis curvula]
MSPSIGPCISGEFGPGAKNLPGACAISHENVLKRQFSRNTWVLAPLSPEKWPGRCPIDQRDKDGFTQPENKLVTGAHSPEMRLNVRRTP